MSESARLRDAEFMARALTLARRGINTVSPNPAVGCVLVKDDVVIGEGWHASAGTAHAEIAALNAAGADPAGGTAYVTLEPCNHHGQTGPCTEALIKAGVARVVAAIQDPNPLVSGQGMARLEQAGIETQVGLLAADAASLNRGFCKRMRTGMPFVTLKIAASLDGRTAAADGSSQWITGAEARADVQRLRAASCAIVTGVETVLADDPAMTVRNRDDARQPLRVVLDSQWRTAPVAEIIGKDRNCLVLGVTDSDRRSALEQAGAEAAIVKADRGHVDLPAAFRLLADRHCNNVLIEAGATLGGAMLTANLVDEIVLYNAPDLLGNAGRAMAELQEIETLSQRLTWRIVEQRRVGRDLRSILQPDRTG